jgi:hypothetical protein
MPRPPRPLDKVADRYFDIPRFERLSQLNPETGCEEWQGSINNAGYGLFGFRNANGVGRMMSAHRARWMIDHNTTVPAGLQVQHTCHNRRCVTSHHLQLGSHQEKMKALMADQRHGFQVCGAKNFDRSNWHQHYDATRIYSVEEIQWCRAARHEEIQARYGVTYQRAEAIRSYMRAGYRWLPYDREATKLRRGRRQK